MKKPMPWHRAIRPACEKGTALPCAGRGVAARDNCLRSRAISPSTARETTSRNLRGGIFGDLVGDVTAMSASALSAIRAMSAFQRASSVQFELLHNWLTVDTMAHFSSRLISSVLNCSRAEAPVVVFGGVAIGGMLHRIGATPVTNLRAWQKPLQLTRRDRSSGRSNNGGALTGV